MNRKSSITAGMLLALAVTSSGQAWADEAKRSNGIYYNRPGATKAELDADLARCTAAAAGTRAWSSGMGGLLPALIDSARSSSASKPNLETCMVVAGWRAVYLTDFEAWQIEKLKGDARKTAFDAQVGLETPTLGVVSWVWANDAAEPKPVNAPYDRSSIAPQAVDLDKPLNVKPGDAVIVVAMRPYDKNEGLTTLEWVRYDRVAKALHTPEKGDKTPDRFRFDFNASGWRKAQGTTYMAVAVPAGDYVLADETIAMAGVFGIPVQSYCLGSPLLTVAPGEVVYLGDLLVMNDQKMSNGRSMHALGYSSDIEAARAALVQRPEIAEALQPAKQQNGATFNCFGQIFYAYAIPGAPSLPTETTIPPEPANATNTAP